MSEEVLAVSKPEDLTQEELELVLDVPTTKPTQTTEPVIVDLGTGSSEEQAEDVQDE